MPSSKVFINNFKGLKNSEDSKQIDPEYFFRIKNFNYPKDGVLGLEKILMPELIETIGSSSIDGAIEYRYLDQNNILRSEVIVVTNGSIYKDALTSPVVIKTGLSTGKVSMVVFNDKLYIANGKDYVYVYDGAKGIVSQMGAPFVEDNLKVGSVSGTYYYAVTYVTAGGEEVLGSVSNTITVNLRRLDLSLPIGYSGVTSRKIYRTVNGGSDLLLLDTIADNSTMTYEDNKTDAQLGALMPAINNELPKPYFLATAYQKIYGAVVDMYPTQVFITDTNNDVFDLASGLDVANYGSDNTPVKGIGIDFGKVLVGTEKNIIIINSDNSTVVTRANVGIKDGHTVRSLPAFGDFMGGLMFVSSLNDIRIMSGLQALPVSTSIDNVRTENWSQAIRGTLEKDLLGTPNLYSEFYNYKYHLLVNYRKYVFDIRTFGWTYHDIRSASYESKPNVLFVIGDELYNGQIDGGIEKEYSSRTYKNEEVSALLESPHIAVESDFKFIERALFWFVPSAYNDIDVTVTTDDNTRFKITSNFNMPGGAYNPSFFSDLYYSTDSKGMDYRVFNVNRMVRWFKYLIECNEGNISFQGVELRGQTLRNKE